MSRGRPSARALDAAVASAPARGEVVFIRSWPGSDCDFLLMTPYGIVAVCVRKTRRIRAEIVEIAEYYRETLNRIRATDRCASISCEFWIWCQSGTMRFFQVDGFRLIEINRFGLPLVPPVTGMLAGTPGKSGPAPGDDPAGQAIPPGKRPGTAAGKKNPGPVPAAADPPGSREPAPARYLRWRNREIQRRNEEGAGGSVHPPASPGIPLPADGAPTGGRIRPGG